MKCFTLKRADGTLDVQKSITVARSNANYLAVGDFKIVVADNVFDEKQKNSEITSVSVRPEGTRIKLCAPSEYSAKERDALVLFHYSSIYSWIKTTTFSGILPGQEIAHDAAKKVILLSLYPGQEVTITRDGVETTARQVKLPKERFWHRQQYKTETDETPRQMTHVLLYTGSEFRSFDPSERVQTPAENAAPRPGNTLWIRLVALEAMPLTSETVAETVSLLDTLERKAEFEPDIRVQFLSTVIATSDRFSAASYTEAAESVAKLGLRFVFAIPEGLGILENRKLLRDRLIALQVRRISSSDTVSGASPSEAQK